MSFQVSEYLSCIMYIVKVIYMYMYSVHVHVHVYVHVQCMCVHKTKLEIQSKYAWSYTLRTCRILSPRRNRPSWKAGPS